MATLLRKRTLTDQSLSASFARVIDWQQSLFPRVRDVRLGYDLWGFPIIGIHWYDKNLKPHEFYGSADSPDLCSRFDAALKKHPASRIWSHC